MSSIQERAAFELKRINFGDLDTEVMLKLLRIFFNHWNSGGGVSVAGPVLARLIEGKPLSPLTGDWDEWIDMTGYGGNDEPIWQNKRCSSVFKKQVPNGDGATWAYDIDAPAQEGLLDWRPIAFPYTPGAEPKPEPRGAPVMVWSGDMADIEEAIKREMREPAITWMPGAAEGGMEPQVNHDPIMAALDAIRSYVYEKRSTILQLTEQLHAEGEHTAAANAKIDDIREAMAKATPAELDEVIKLLKAGQAK